MNWQTPVALIIVAITAAIMLRNARKKRKSCGGNCGCTVKPPMTHDN